MGKTLRADAEALRLLAGTLRGRAEEIAVITVATPFSEAASGMPDSATGSAVAAAAAPAEAAYTTIAAKIRDMAAAAESSATSYEETEQLFRSQLSRYQNGL
ncbi:type VII secretion target [Rhodococcus sp. NPDC056743]|uniref:type VII secretion target n=1 Tax=Rhodococcus sp. NPDC056743 TaxID=3345934 RepID=UPI00366FD365